MLHPPDHDAIADILRQEMDGDDQADVTVYNIMSELCEYFERDNSRFDSDRFRIACGFGDVVAAEQETGG